MSAIKYYNTTTGTWDYLSQGPKGEKGATGTTGPTGPQGTSGVVAQATAPTDTTVAWLDTSVSGLYGGIPSGGATNQVLAKGSATDYDTKWASIGTVSSITASAPLTGGTITSAGTIGLDQTALAITPSQVAGTAVVTSDARLSDTRTPTDGTVTDAKIASTLSPSKITGQAYTITNKRADTFGPTTGVDVYPRMICTANAPFVNGTNHFAFFNAPENVTVSKIGALSPVAGTDSGGTTVRRLGLYTLNNSTYAVTLVARTDSDPTLFTSFSYFERSFSSTGGYPTTYSLVAGQWYAVGFICYNTGGTFNAPSILGPPIQNGLQNLAPYMCGNITGQTDLVTSGTVTVGGTTINRWARLT